MTRPSPGLRGGVGDQSPEDAETETETYECSERGCKREFGKRSSMRRHRNACIRGRDAGGVLDD